ncbi:arginine/serine-rich protein 1 isoform X2 [Scyliorhinus canicula]|uniref:arginine/serine-rich protein 1 isoform X2 n=1 Tax=Scyliorhinus canicula TaxID=7830 RepID=UPI0018F68E09|nr:arginine/serine-rich protein 1 isoform X2 [Scyliorhinus canicula]
MVITEGSGRNLDSLKNQVSDCNRRNSVGFSQETMREMPSYGETNMQQGSDNVLKSDSEMEQMSEKDVEMEWGMDGYAQEQKTENIATVVNKLRLCSPCQKTEKNVRKSPSRTVGIMKSKIARSSSVSSSGSSRSGSVSSSSSIQSGSVSSSDSSRSSSCSSSSSRSSSTSSGPSRSCSVSSAGSSRSCSVSSSGSSCSGSERYGSSSDEISLTSRGRCASLKRRYGRPRQAYSRSRSRSWSRSCSRRSRCRMPHQPLCRYRPRSRCYVPSSRSYQRSRSSLRCRRSCSRSRSRSPSRFQRSYYGFACRTRAPSHRRSRSRSRGRSIHLTQKEKKKLLEIAKENADKLLGKGKMHLPPSLLKNEKPFEAKTNSDAVKELTRKEVLNIRSLPKKRPTVF